MTSNDRDGPKEIKELDPQLVWLFMVELRYQCVFGGSAYQSLLAAVNDLRRGGATETVFWLTHSFLTHAAVISRILWPDTRIHSIDKLRVGDENVGRLQEIRRQRGPQLVGELKLDETPIVKSKRLRTNLEHYDERLESWAIASPDRVIALRNIAPRGGIDGVARSMSSLPSISRQWCFHSKKTTLTCQRWLLSLVRFSGQSTNGTWSTQPPGSSFGSFRRLVGSSCVQRYAADSDPLPNHSPSPASKPMALIAKITEA